MEHSFVIPNKPLNSDKFLSETGFNLFIRDGALIVSGDCTQEEAQEFLDAHDGTIPKPTIAEKLASVGLSIEELKAALGGN